MRERPRQHKQDFSTVRTFQLLKNVVQKLLELGKKLRISD
jgi:hypothetical protein